MTVPVSSTPRDGSTMRAWLKTVTVMMGSSLCAEIRAAPHLPAGILSP
jgi:hypothetical protein